MKNKKWILISIVIAIVAYLFYRRSGGTSLLVNKAAGADEPIVNAPIPEGATFDDLALKIEGYNDQPDIGKAVIWISLFARCPYWKAFIEDQYSVFAGRDLISLNSYNFDVAKKFVADGVSISEKFQKCGNSYTRTAGNLDYPG